MNFLIDAQLPRRLKEIFRSEGHDAIHTLDLPLENRTTDQTINEISTRDRRVVVTKDSDFIVSFVIQRVPWKLLLISTGNIHNRELEKLLRANLEQIVKGFAEFDYIELTNSSVIFHG